MTKKNDMEVRIWICVHYELSLQNNIGFCEAFMMLRKKN